MCERKLLRFFDTDYCVKVVFKCKKVVLFLVCGKVFLQSDIVCEEYLHVGPMSDYDLIAFFPKNYTIGRYLSRPCRLQALYNVCCCYLTTYSKRRKSRFYLDPPNIC